MNDPTVTLANPASASLGDLLRAWRGRRRMSQLDLATEAEISARHLSFVETGRARPSREMVLTLAEALEVPLRERNALLMAAGYAPLFTERALADPALSPAREAIDAVLKGHEPFPALAVDRRWTLIGNNRAVDHLLEGLPADVLAPPVNVLRLSLHPRGLAPRIVNYAHWRAHLFARLKRDFDLTGDAGIAELIRELRAYPVPEHARLAGRVETPAPAMVLPLSLASPAGVLNFISTVTVFGTPIDVTLSEIAIESFFPADAHTAEVLRALAAAAAPG
ncbi:MAG: helix-turn-helix transcriptional regulator [Burkholderiales bacterium]|nr:helix-turn-helix transcriptional regulator [Burkholderiales bacterium]